MRTYVFIKANMVMIQGEPWVETKVLIKEVFYQQAKSLKNIHRKYYTFCLELFPSNQQLVPYSCKWIGYSKRCLSSTLKVHFHTLNLNYNKNFRGIWYVEAQSFSHFECVNFNVSFFGQKINKSFFDHCEIYSIGPFWV